jgi:hypothetical protein
MLAPRINRTRLREAELSERGAENKVRIVAYVTSRLWNRRRRKLQQQQIADEFAGHCRCPIMCQNILQIFGSYLFAEQQL